MNQLTTSRDVDEESDLKMSLDGSGVKQIQFISVTKKSRRVVDAEIVDEALVCISVNGHELANFMCSPAKLDQLALGFLYNEKLIESTADIRSLHISKNDLCVDVWLHDMDFEPPEREIVTAGCGGGVTFDDLSQQHQPLKSDFRATPEQLADLMRKMHVGAELYKRARGIHTAALANTQDLLMQVEDVGRHNCLDRLAGVCLVNDIESRDRILLSSGRISSEMINKARRLGTPIVCSRTSPTSLSVALARSWSISIVAYVRKERMRIYTHPDRIIDE